MNILNKIAISLLLTISCFVIPYLNAQEIDCDEVLAKIEESKSLADLYDAEQKKLLTRLDEYNAELNINKYKNTNQTISENFTDCIKLTNKDNDFCEIVHEKYFDIQNKKQAIYNQARVVGDNSLENQRQWAEYIDLASDNDCYKYKR